MAQLSGRELLHESRQALDALVARERQLQADLATKVFAPVDAVFDLLEQSGAMLERQADSLQAAARALDESAALWKAQAELFERAVATARQPAELAKSAAGAPSSKRKRRQPGDP